MHGKKPCVYPSSLPKGFIRHLALSADGKSLLVVQGHPQAGNAASLWTLPSKSRLTSRRPCGICFSLGRSPDGNPLWPGRRALSKLGIGKLPFLTWAYRHIEISNDAPK